MFCQTNVCQALINTSQGRVRVNSMSACHDHLMRRHSVEQVADVKDGSPRTPRARTHMHETAEENWRFLQKKFLTAVQALSKRIRDTVRP
jgi:hypothetical protein